MAAYTVDTYAVIGRAGLNQAIGTTSTTQLHKLGERCRARGVSGSTRGEAEFIYLQGVASTVVGSLALVKNDFTTSLATARDKGAMALASAAIVASNYGWYQISGIGVAACAAGIVLDAAMYLTGAGGVGTVNDAAVAGDQIIGMRAASTDDTSTCLVSMGVNPACADFDNA